MKLFNPNTPLSNFIYTIITDKNKQIKENILLGEITFPKILFYSKRNEDNFRTNSHMSFINNLNRQKQLLEVREEKSNLEKKVNMVDNQLLCIKNNHLTSNNNILSYNKRYLNTNINNIKTKQNSDSKSNNSKKKSHHHRNKSEKSLSSDKKSKNENVKSLPTLGKDKNIEKRIQNISLKPIKIKSYKSNSKVNNHETEEKLEKNAKAFIHKINNNKKNILAMINKRQEKFSLRLKNEIEKMELQKQLKLDEYNKNNNINLNGNLYNNNNIEYNNFNNYSNLDTIRKEDYKYSPDNSRIIKNNNKTNIINKKYYHYSPYSYRNPKMLKNLSKDLLNFNSELYYNNNIPDIIQYQSILVPMYRNNNIINRDGSSPMIIVEDLDTLRNINNNIDIIDATNGDIYSNISRIQNYSKRNDESIIDNNNIDYSFNKKHLYYFNEPKYEIELTNAENEIDKSKVKIKNNNL